MANYYGSYTDRELVAHLNAVGVSGLASELRNRLEAALMREQEAEEAAARADCMIDDLHEQLRLARLQ